jgi:hypothetical protein
MKREKQALIILACLVVVLAIALAFVLGRSSVERDQQAAAEPAKSDEPRSPAAPVAEPLTNKAASPPPARPGEPDADAGFRRLIVGYWANGNCDTDNGERFVAGGRYEAYEAHGRWRIEGGRLLVTVTHAQQDPNAGLGEGEITRIARPRTVQSEIISIAPERMVLITGGDRYSLIRCRNPSL